MVRVALFGATGGTGRLTLRRLLARGDTVVALVRQPAALQQLQEELTPDERVRLVVQQGDLFDQAAVARAVSGTDVVVFVAGVASIKQAATQKTTIYSVGGGNVLGAMAAAGVRRLVAVTSQGVVDSPQERLLYRWVIKPLLMRDMYNDMILLEQAILQRAASGSFTYCILRPTRLMDGPVGGGARPRVGSGELPAGRLLYEVDRADLADLVARAVAGPAELEGRATYITA